VRVDEHSRWLVVGRAMLRGIRPPAEGGARRESLRFVRDIQLRVLMLWVPIFVVLVLVASPWVVFVAIAAIALLIADIAYLSFRAR
jgi:hypothetical protein